MVTFDWNGAAEGVAWELVPSVENAILASGKLDFIISKTIGFYKIWKARFLKIIPDPLILKSFLLGGLSKKPQLEVLAIMFR